MRNVHDILRDLAIRAMGGSGDTIKASPNDAHLIKIILEMLELMKKWYSKPYLHPDEEHRAELFNIIKPRIAEIDAEIIAADGS